MSDAVITIVRPQIAVPSGLIERVRALTPVRETVALGAILAVLQILDGVLTALGVHYFGLGAEANPFIRNLMVLMGPNTALVLLKSLALAIIATLCAMSSSVRWLPLALRCIIVLYIVAAVVPWSAILLAKLS